MKYKFVLILIFFLTDTISNSFENKILFKIENEIITSIDIYNEAKYIASYNKELNKLNDNQIFEISKKSLLKEKIKKLEIIKNGINLNIDEMFTDNLVKNSFPKLGIENIQEFENYISKIDIEIRDIKEKTLIETFWKNLIFTKFQSKINIDRNSLKEEIIKNKSESISYYLYEILFAVNEIKEIEKKYNEIEKTILNSSFENAALKHSISDSSKLNGEIGWIEESSINRNIVSKISELKKGQYSRPISTPGGILILMVKDIKKKKLDINLDKEIEKLIRIKTNQQFEQYSNLYFNKISKNFNVKEY